MRLFHTNKLKAFSVLFGLIFLLLAKSDYAMEIDSDPENHSRTSSQGSSGSNWSDEELAGEDFAQYLKNRGERDYARYAMHIQSPSENLWRKERRDDYLDNVIIPKIVSQFNKPGSTLKDTCNNFNTGLGLSTILTAVREKAAQAFPDGLVEPNVIGTYRHKLCKIYIDNIKAYCSTTSYMQEIETEVSYTHRVKSNTGKVRLDVFWPSKGIVYDYKFGDAKITSKDERKWQKHVPNYTGYFELSE